MVSLTVFPSFFSKVAAVKLCLQLSVTPCICICTLLFVSIDSCLLLLSSRNSQSCNEAVASSATVCSLKACQTEQAALMLSWHIAPSPAIAYGIMWFHCPQVLVGPPVGEPIICDMGVWPLPVILV
jgi:hypothetical protein